MTAVVAAEALAPAMREGDMQTVVIVIHLMIVLAMIGVVLLQKSEGGGLGMGGGAGFLSSRGTANVLTRTTAILALGFFLTSLTLSILAGLDRKPRSILQNTGTTPATVPAPGGAPPPLDQGGGGLLDTLRGQSAPSAPGAPAEGGAPQLPQPQ
jgi:preprotein translocase subunit SecG